MVIGPEGSKGPKGGDMLKIARYIFGVIFLFIFTSVSYACTSLRVKTTDGYVFYARTLEGVSFDSTISIIPKDTVFKGTLPDGAQKGLSWTTKYGMVGMNAFGLPMLIDGVNEKGLAVGNLMFPGFAEYQTFEARDSSKTIAQWEVVSWILSNFATVEEVKEGIKNIRVCKQADDKKGFLELHYTIHDPSGASLVIEYVKGELKVYDNPIGVFTNSPPFDWHLINLRNHINISAVNVPLFEIDGLKASGLGQGTGMLGLPGDYTPPSRFVRMTALVLSALPVTGPDEGLNLAMTLINNVDIAKGAVRDMGSKGPVYDTTDWVNVTDLGRKRFYFRTYDNKNWRFVDVDKALKNTKAVMFIPIKTAPEYTDVTGEAKEYGKVPLDYFPAGKP